MVLVLSDSSIRTLGCASPAGEAAALSVASCMTVANRALLGSIDTADSTLPCRETSADDETGRGVAAVLPGPAEAAGAAGAVLLLLPLSCCEAFSCCRVDFSTAVMPSHQGSTVASSPSTSSASTHP
jgi:hypothetical protein